MTTGGQAITQRDIARSLGVSVSAVSLALAGRDGVSDALRERVLATAAELGYRPNASAVALRTRRSNVLGLLIRNLRNPHFLDVIDGFDETCAKAGYDVMVGSSRYDPEREQELLDAFADRSVDGLAIAPIGASRRVRVWAKATGRPVVLLNANPAASGGGRSAMTVRSDDVAAVELAVRHLVDLGHRRLAMVAAPADKSPDPMRLDHFTQLGRRLGFTARAVVSELSEAAVRAAVRRELRRPARVRPTAVITNSDYLAHAVYLAAADLGLRVPDDLSVLGHDDLPTSASLAPALSTIAVDRREIGERAAGLLVAALGEQRLAARHVTVPVQLRARASTAPPPARAGSQRVGQPV